MFFFFLLTRVYLIMFVELDQDFKSYLFKLYMYLFKCYTKVMK